MEALKDPAGPKLLVRAEKSRKVEQEHLWAFMAKQACVGVLKIPLSRSANRQAREAMVEVRFSAVELCPPKGRDTPPILVWAVYLVEPEPEEGTTPLEWMLLTTVPVLSAEEARQRVVWYGRR